MSDKASVGEPAASAGETPSPGGTLLKGTTVAPGLALGTVHRKDYDLLRQNARRVPLDQVERELNRFHKALTASRKQLEDLKQRLVGRVPADHARILDTHVAYLKDSVFLSDVENLILNEQMGLSAAIGKVISDFDRIFRLVQNEALRERAVDLRDVGIRVLRNLERNGDEDATTLPPTDYVLVARELSIVDMFDVDNRHVLGIVTEEGGLTSHAAILARSMRIPTVTGVHGLLDVVREGDTLILDATEGAVRINPDELVLAQYAKAREEHASAEQGAVGVPDWANLPARTLDGQSIHVAAACGNLPDVDQAASFGLREVGLYRTELLYLVDRDQPSLESLVAHYAAVVEHARSGAVTFRLLHVDSSLEIPYLYPHRELNPGLGRAGVRILLEHDGVLRRQCQAILRACVGQRVRIAVPFVSDCGELRRVKEALFEERYAMRRRGEDFAEDLELGVVIETPVAVLGAADLAKEADFLIIGLDSLLQYLLAADRENHELRASFETLHPCVLRALTSIVAASEAAGVPLSVFGVSAVQPVNLPFLLGVGLRQFCVAPVALREFLHAVRRVDVRKAHRDALLAARASCQAETQSLVDGYRHGFAPPAR